MPKLIGKDATRFNRRRFLRGTGGAAVFFGAFTLVGCGDDDDDADLTSAPTSEESPIDGETPMSGESPMAGETPDEMATLYERLGGNAAISAVVTEFLGNVAADDRINSFFANTDLDRLNTLLVEQIGMASGGPETYTGRDMATTHAGLEITEDDFNALVEDLVMALDTFEVPDQEQMELLSVLGPMQADIVTA